MKLHRLIEAATSSRLSSVLNYLEKKLGTKLVKIFDNEEFTNSVESGVGIRYVQSGTAKCIRFNWANESSVGDISKIQSIDLFNGNSSNPSFNVKIEGVPLVKALPALVKIINNPSTGKTKVLDIETPVTESVVMESINLTATQIVTDFTNRLGKGEAISRDTFVKDYSLLNAGIFDFITKEFAADFENLEDGKSLIYPKKAAEIKKKVLNDAGTISVESGGSSETYTNDESEVVTTKISYSDSLEHLENLVKTVVGGASNGLFITGPGGTGKTQTVERALSSAGLSDGDGYFKIAGSASAPGIYTALYHNRHSIVLFDDADGALSDVDARNLIKAATDTKKSRKLSWGKKSSFIFNPDSDDAGKHFNDPDMAPSEFLFYGRIIFISNLPLNKLDPDGSLRTRAFIINIDPTRDEMLDHLEFLLDKIKLNPGLTLTMDERKKVLDVIKKDTRKDGLSIRKLVRALNLAASGEGNWETLVKLYS